MRVVRFTHPTGHSTLPQRHCLSCHNWYRVTGFTTGFTRCRTPSFNQRPPTPFSGYSLQANRKTREGGSHPDRNAQFEFINAQVQGFQKRKQPVVSVDTKKKELVGDFRNVGREWRPQGQPEEVRVHDFQDKTLGKAIPYGVYDITNNQGWVSVGIDHDTAEFAAASILAGGGRWGKRFPDANELIITPTAAEATVAAAACGRCIADIADETGLKLTVCHFPPGTSKWNKIEHRLFCHHHPELERQASGQARQTIVSLIAVRRRTYERIDGKGRLGHKNR